jgi:hypothetical protein
LRPKAERQILHGHAGPGIEQLVAAAPEGEAGMASEPADYGPGFLIEHAKVGRRSLVAIAGQRKLLPDHDTKFIACVEKLRLVYDRAAPCTQQVQVRAGKERELFAVALRRERAGKNLRADPVGAAGKDGASIYFEGHRNGRLRGGKTTPAELIGGHDEADTAQADALRDGLHHPARPVERFHRAGVQRRPALCVRPPQIRLLQLDAQVAKRTNARSDPMAGRCAKRPTHGGGTALGHEAQVGRGEVGGEIEGHFHLIEPYAGRADFEIGVVPNPERNEAGMKIPSVGDRGLAGLAVLPSRLGNAEVLGRWGDNDLHRGAVPGVGQVDFKG